MTTQPLWPKVGQDCLEPNQPTYYLYVIKFNQNTFFSCINAILCIDSDKKCVLHHSDDIVLNGKTLTFLNKLGILSLGFYESIRTKAYVIAMYVHLDPRSCFWYETESKQSIYTISSSNFHYYGYIYSTIL